jgi:hypothetical protein
MEAEMKSKRRLYAWIAAIAAGFLLVLFGAFGEIKGKSVVIKPIVYLIPEDFIGPVFVFFDQKDGVDMIADPLGNAVHVPTNGVIKLKGTVDNLISENKTVRNMYWVSVSKKGLRKIMWVVNPIQKDEEGEWVYSYFDEAGKLHHTAGTLPKDVFFYLPLQRRNERMLLAHDGCKHQKFAPPGTPKDKFPDCAKFLIASPNEYIKMPDWLWMETNHEYESIQEFEFDANERVLKIEKHYSTNRISGDSKIQ